MPTIPLTKGHTAIIDPEDADLLAHRWWATETPHGHVYAQRHTRLGNRSYRKVALHREIGARIYGGPLPKGMVVDHISGDTMDHRRANLRVVTATVNTWNQTRASKNSKSGLRGVYQKRPGRWEAYICEGLTRFTLGYFNSPEEAYAARLAAEAKRMERAAA